MKRNKNVWIVKMIFFSFLAIITVGVVVMWLWNWLVPSLFAGPVINYYQALGLFLLSRILFRGFTGSSHHGCKGRGPDQWKDKWSNLSDGEREKLRDLWKKRCGSFGDCSDMKSDQGETNAEENLNN